jgi:hypothetical protein
MMTREAMFKFGRNAHSPSGTQHLQGAKRVTGGTLLQRRAVPLPSLCLLAILAVGCHNSIDAGATGPAPSERDATQSTERITFVQMTDPDLFDAGGLRHGPGIEEEALDNRAAFHWAILETNRLVLAEHRTIDFVVITGNFGLENVELPAIGNLPGAMKCYCPKRTKGKEGPIAPVPLHEAAEEVARDLDALVVRNVYLVPGNSDLCDESPGDLHRWAEFVVEVRRALGRQAAARKAALEASFPREAVDNRLLSPPDVVDLTYSLERLYNQKDERIRALLETTNDAGRVPDPPEFGGIRLVGLDSAYFRPHAVKAIQEASIGGSKKEMDFVAGRIKKYGSYIVFTHIPDVQDPDQGRELTNLVPDRASSWKISAEARKEWYGRIIGQSEVIAVFAGHFHTSRRELFPHDFSYSKPAANETTAAKMWVAPPLSVRYQWTVPPAKTARGMLLVTVATNGAIRVSPEDAEEVKSTPIWFSTLDQKAATDGDDKLVQARAEQRDSHWDTAGDLYAQALASSDSRTRASAMQGFERARRVTRTWWWRWGKYFPPFRWWDIHHRGTVWALVIFIFVLIGLVTVILGHVRRFRGRARVNTPTSIAENSPVSLFAAQIPLAALDVRQRWKRAGLDFLSGGTTLLSLPSAVADQISQTLPEVYKINVGKYLAFLLALGGYFKWQVDSQLAYCPDPPAKAGTPPGPAGRMRAFATLRWGWINRATLAVTCKATGPLDCERAAYAIAARVLGAAVTKGK